MALGYLAHRVLCFGATGEGRMVAGESERARKLAVPGHQEIARDYTMNRTSQEQPK